MRNRQAGEKRFRKRPLLRDASLLRRRPFAIEKLPHPEEAASAAVSKDEVPSTCFFTAC
jgi:hypothetical protein